MGGSGGGRKGDSKRVAAKTGRPPLHRARPAALRCLPWRAHLHVEGLPLLVDGPHALQVAAPVEQQHLLLLRGEVHDVQALRPASRLCRAVHCRPGNGRASTQRRGVAAGGAESCRHTSRGSRRLHACVAGAGRGGPPPVEKELGSLLISSITRTPSARSAACGGGEVGGGVGAWREGGCSSRR